jgi:ABC-2 type transport system permease protein
MIDSLRRIGALARHNTVLRLRDPGQFLSYLVMPMVLMLALKPLFERAVTGGTTHIATGTLVIFSALALSIVGNSTLAERSWHTWDRLRSTRASVTELLVGKTLPAYGLLLLQQTILLAYGVTMIGAHPHDGSAYGLLLLSIVVWGAALLAIGTAMAAVVRSHGELSAACDVGALTLTTLGGAFVPVSMFPSWLQTIAPASPSYWSLSMLQHAMRGDTTGTLWRAAVLLGVGAVAAAFAYRRLATGWGRSTML